MTKLLSGKSILITGGTGSLGSALVRRIVYGDYGLPRRIVVFSRDELKQSVMANGYKGVGYLHFVIGDVRNYASVVDVIREADIVVHAAALKRVGTCEGFPDEAMMTNYMGASNIVRAIKEADNKVQCVVGVSSDKGAKPLNVYGMTKALQEHRFIIANNEYPSVRFVCVRYGNVMGSRGSVIPIWQELIARGEPIKVTEPTMTRFLLTLDQAVDTLLVALEHAQAGEIFVPCNLPAASIGDLAGVMCEGSASTVQVVGKQRGEKMHETLITEDEISRTVKKGTYYAITDNIQAHPALNREYVSNDYVLGVGDLRELLVKHGIIKRLHIPRRHAVRKVVEKVAS